jgi:kynurenine formamidase
MADPVPLPSHADLPVVDGAPPGSSWGLWGADDRLGCLNLLTPERIVEASRLVQRGAVFPLDAPLDVVDPPLFGREPMRHTVASEGDPQSIFHDDQLDNWNTQASTQWDGFRHIPHPVHRFYGGLDEKEHGIDHWAERGLVGRGVLADVARWLEADGRPLTYDKPEAIEPDDVLRCLAEQGVEVEPGDVLMIRTGWLGWYLERSAEVRAEMAKEHANPGLRPGVKTAQILWDLHIAAVAADNPALEVWPPGALASPEEMQAAFTDREKTPEVFVHTALLPLLGMPIGEFFVLDALAEDCAADGRYTCMFTSAPLHLRRGVASPPNALAIK